MVFLFLFFWPNTLMSYTETESSKHEVGEWLVCGRMRKEGLPQVLPQVYYKCVT
jgi:hypothetical protein